MSNFRQISEKFWAGGQPSPEDLAQLARQGVKSIVNLRSRNLNYYLILPTQL